MSRHSSYINELLQLRQTTDRLIRRELRRTLPLGTLTAEQKEEAKRILRIAEPKDLSHSQMARIRRNRLPVPKAASFANILVHEWQSTRLGIAIPGRELDNKQRGYKFADLIGARRPETDNRIQAIREVRFSFPRVIKPVSATGARGVYLCFAPDHYLHLRDRTEFSSWKDLQVHASSLISDPKRPLQDRWFTEELILESDGVAARDLKFYAFYGNVLLALEVVRYPKLQSRFWNRDGEPIDSGHRYEFFEGDGITPDQIATVEAISLQIPRPFMRIDMLSGVDELVLGEFTPRPGQFEGFNQTWDRRLGIAWMRAERQLINDLIDGKEFSAFKQIARDQP